jgi:AcrR family transcriptional regulator
MDRRDEILDQAFRLVGESGLASLTMRKVAERVGFTETAAYRYFPHKQALLLGMAEKLRHTLLEPIKAIAASQGTTAERLQRILRHHVDFVLERQGLPILLIAEAASTGDRQLITQLGGIIDEYVTALAELISERPQGAGNAGPRELALLLMGIPAGLAIRTRIRPDYDLEQRVVTTLIPAVVRFVVGDDDGATP